MTGGVKVLGVRHHGPGSARSVAAALDEFGPTAVVIEGAPELDAVAPLAASPEMVPPVAGLVYAVTEPRRAAFYPLAAFSPEWVALRWALAAGAVVRFADLPAANALAPGDRGHIGGGTDAVGTLAALAGYDDPERWWEDAVEHRYGTGANVLDRFAALTEAMAGLRSTEETDTPSWSYNERREAAMRRILREVSSTHPRVAVVCGAYHAPALVPGAWPAKARDTARLAGLPKVKVAATWAPWTAGRLARASGYGAGVTAPGWYQHLFVTSEDVVPTWLVRAAGVLRAEHHDAPPAAVVEAVRLAETLAVLRGRPSVGLDEVNEATVAVLGGGSTHPLAIVAERLIVGESLGSVPPDTPMVPLAADLERLQRSLRLKPAATAAVVTLDLRKDGPRARSVLLHRLRLLGVDWGVPVEAGRTAGTFKEGWRLEWRPELSVALIEAGGHGTTVEQAAGAKVAGDAASATDLATLARLVEGCLVADLPAALTEVVAALEERTAHQHDALVLLDAIEPLARTCRYGDVRGVDVTGLRTVLGAVVTRASVGLRPAAAALDDDAAARLRGALDAAHRGVTLLDDPALLDPWRTALAAIAVQEGVHGWIGGRANRLLLDAGLLAVEEAGRRLSRRLSRAADPAAGAAWLDGFVAGEAVLLLHDAELLATVDGWVAAIGDDTFQDLLPLLRRTFAGFEPAERRELGEHLARLRSGRPPAGDGEAAIDEERARPAVRAVAALLGLTASPLPAALADPPLPAARAGDDGGLP
jgi:hypothetical protein